MRVSRLMPVAALCAVTMAACGTATPVGLAIGSGSATAPGSNTASGTPAATARLDVTDLIGNWTVNGDGVEDGTIVTVDAYEMRIWTRCGLSYANWGADPTGLFAASINSWSGDCGGTQTRWPWAVTAHAWSRDGSAVVLHGPTGAVTARLEPGGVPTTGPDVLGELGDPPTLAPDDTSRLSADPALPRGLTPATPARLVGEWVARGFTVAPSGADGPVAPWVTFDRDLTWAGSDGCNMGSGAWTLGEQGRYVGTVGAMTLVGCDGADVPGWVGEARRAGFDGATLVLVGRDGRELGRLTRI